MPRTEASGTIPALLVTAAERDPHGVWLRTDDGSATFAGAAGQVARLVDRLASVGVRPRDLVLVTTGAGVVFCWLRLRSGSLLAPIGLHWAVNGVGILASSVVWTLTT